MLVLLLLGVLSACAAPPPEPLPLPPEPPPVVEAPAPAVAPAAAAQVVKRFDKANLKEPTVVFGDTITAEKIGAIHAADHQARRALTTLGRHMTPKALRRAHNAVIRLEKTLE